jgi:hypothetical protein
VETPSTPPAATPSASEARWAFGVSVYTYVVPHDRDYAQPTITADRDWLHLEVRYDYEATETGSLWLGYNFAGGDTLAWTVTPMLGGVVGDTWGIAPGVRGSVAWWRLELSSEDEYVFDTTTSHDSFFYSWSELTLAPLEWVRIGLAGQRTRAYKTDRDLQRGVLAGVSYEHVNLTTYVFDPDTHTPTIVVAVGVEF